MSQFWNQRIRRLQPYVPGEQPQDQQYIKLNTNENPVAPSEAVRQAMHDAVEDRLNLYPDPDCKDLKNAVADYYALPVECVFVGNGSDEVLAHIFSGLFDPAKPLLCPDISYSFYPVYARLYDIELRRMPLNDRFEIELQNYPSENGGVIFANPNAPTSVALGRDAIEQFLQRNRDSVVVVDEAYVDFGAQSCVPLVSSYPNLVVTQTLSKSRSLAGLRVGFSLASRELTEGLERLKNSFNSYPLDKVAQAGAAAAMRDTQSFIAACTATTHIRDRARLDLQALDFEVLESAANFLFARPRFMAARVLYAELKAAGVLVRYFDAPRISEHLRISVGTEAEMKTLMDRIAKIREAQDKPVHASQ